MRSEGEMLLERAHREHEVRLCLSLFNLFHPVQKRAVRLLGPIVLVWSMIGFPCLNPRCTRRDARSLICLVLVLIVVQGTPQLSPRLHSPYPPASHTEARSTTRSSNSPRETEKEEDSVRNSAVS
jgi:hypothetical protein